MKGIIKEHNVGIIKEIDRRVGSLLRLTQSQSQELGPNLFVAIKDLSPGGISRISLDSIAVLITEREMTAAIELINMPHHYPGVSLSLSVLLALIN